MSNCPDCATHAAEAERLGASAAILRVHVQKLWPNVTLEDMASAVGVSPEDLAEARRRIRRGEL